MDTCTHTAKWVGVGVGGGCVRVGGGGGGGWAHRGIR